MNRKGILFGVMALIYLILIIGILVLLIWFGLRISDGIQAVTDFLEKYGIWIFVLIVIVMFRNPIINILRFIFGKVGIKI